MADELKQRVLEAARALFMAHGYEAVGMREIAKAVGRQPVQVYRLNLSKSDILAEIIVQLNQEQIDRLPELCALVKGLTAYERTCSFLFQLYKSDIQYMPIRSVGAAFGWVWTGDYERRVIQQVFQLVKPISDWMSDAGFEEIPARCYGIWSLYYVGYRAAVMRGAGASECLEEIKPSLRYFFC